MELNATQNESSQLTRCVHAKLSAVSEFLVFKFPANKSIIICDILKQKKQ